MRNCGFDSGMRVRVGALIATVIVAAVFIGTDPTAGALPSPTQLRARSRAVAIDGAGLSDVSCTSPSSCVAVGSYQVRTGFVSFSESWDGRRWSIIATQNPSAWVGLGGITCTSGTDCTAVGGYGETVGNTHTLIEHWNGRDWSIVASPTPTGASNASLGVVSCSSANACMAVGDYQKGSAITYTLAEHWDGSRWSIVPTARPAARDWLSFGSVSCSSAKNCVAVGNWSKAGHGRMFAERWNGTKWALMPVPSPRHVTDFSFDGVTCTSDSSCIALGETGRGGVANTLVEHWDGRRWAIVNSPTPANAGIIFMGTPSCASTTNCLAVGTYYLTTNADVSAQIVSRWDGTRWTTAAGPFPPSIVTPGANWGQLGSVSCVTKTFCMGVGSYFTSTHMIATLTRRWTGSAWSLIASPTPS